MTRKKNIFILGSGRSGTSLVAGLFRNSGIFLGSEFYKPRESNPLGFFEDRTVNLINEEILKTYLPSRMVYKGVNYGTDSPKDGQRWLARISLDTNIKASKDIQIKIEKLTSNQPFCLKDPRFSYTIDAWRQHINNARYICIFRDPGVVVNSILKEVASVPYLHDFAISIEHAFEVWYLMYKHILMKHSLSGEWLFLNYDDLFEEKELKRIEKFTGLSIDFKFPDIKYKRSSSQCDIPLEMEQVYNELLQRSKI